VVQNELVNRTQASAGLVSRIVKHLTHQAFLEKTGSREFRLREPLALLDAWAASDDLARRATTARFSAFSDNPLELADKLKALATKLSLPIAFTQWIGGWLRHPYTEPVVVSAYVPHPPSDDALEAAGFRRSATPARSGSTSLKTRVFSLKRRQSKTCLLSATRKYISIC